MTCADCTRASAELWHGFRAACVGCEARAVARGPHYFRCRRAGRLDAGYRDLIARLGLTHDQVKAADAEDFIRREASR